MIYDQIHLVKVSVLIQGTPRSAVGWGTKIENFNHKEILTLNINQTCFFLKGRFQISLVFFGNFSRSWCDSKTENRWTQMPYDVDVNI